MPNREAWREAKHNKDIEPVTKVDVDKARAKLNLKKALHRSNYGPFRLRTASQGRLAGAKYDYVLSLRESQQVLEE